MHIRTSLMLAPLALCGLAACGAQPVTADERPVSARVRVDVAFCPGCDGAKAPRPIDLAICLDTSGSMQGLIHAARRKIWSVVSELATAKPAPMLRVALLTYGSPGNDADGHVVVQTDFTNDLDLVSERLFALTTNGGEEYVGRVVSRALDGLDWSKGNGLRQVFVAGNESADQDPAKPFRDEARRATERGIFVNAIYCGGADDGDAGGWRELSLVGKGRFASIDKDHGTLAIATPFDADLAALSGKINATYVAYGRRAAEGAARQEAQDKNAVGAGAPAAAERAAAKASGLYDNGGWDLVDRLQAEPALDLAKLKDEELPADLKQVPVADRRGWLEAKRTERAALQEQIKALDAKRQAHVKAEMEKQRLTDDAGLDKALKEALREQAGAAGFTFEPVAPIAPVPRPAPASTPTPR
jgi:hypothetical protein